MAASKPKGRKPQTTATRKKATARKKASAKKRTPVAKNAPAARKKASVASKKPAAKEVKSGKKPIRKKSTAQKKKAAGPVKPGNSSQTTRKTKSAGHGHRKGSPMQEQPLMAALRAEHRHMGNVMRLLEQQLDAIAGGELVDTHVVYEIMDYMVNWPDQYHHPREDLIYSRVAELDVSMEDEVDTLQRDHDNTAKQGRGMLKLIMRWRQGEASGADVVERGRAYIAHIYEHMNVEEKVVFPHIERILDLEEWRLLAEDDQLQAVGRPVFGPQIQRQFRNLSRKLRRSMQESVARGAIVEWMGIESLMESFAVMSIAYESVRDSTSGHVRTALRDSVEIIRHKPLTAPLRLTANNAKATLKILGDVAGISRETVDDLIKVGQEHRDRLRLLERDH